MTPPHEPFVPEITAGDLSQPLRCLDCGAELELRCGEGHLHTKNVGQLPPAPKVKTKQCSGCGQPFEPRPWQRQCDRCAKAPPAAQVRAAGHQLAPNQRKCTVCQPPAQHGTHQARVYRPKVCSCGATFTPTGPRATRCAKCRGTT